MKAFEVFVNGRRLCLAGVGQDGVLNAMVDWVRRPERGDDISLRVGGLDSVADEFLLWAVPPIGVGDEVLVRIVEATSVDPPTERQRSERPTTLDQYRACLRGFGEQLTDDERRVLLRDLVADLEGRLD